MTPYTSTVSTKALIPTFRVDARSEYIPLGVIANLAKTSIGAGGLLRWRGTNLQSPDVLLSIKNEFIGFSKEYVGTHDINEIWNLFIRQF